MQYLLVAKLKHFIELKTKQLSLRIHKIDVGSNLNKK
jgi:hypothetical protein